MSTVAVILLLLLFVDQFSDYFVLLVVAELGIIAVIIYALAAIVNYTATEQDIKNAILDTNVKVCPNMWAKSGKNDDTTCNPVVTLPSEDDIYEYKYQFKPAEATATVINLKTLKQKDAVTQWQPSSSIVPLYSWTAVEAVNHISNSDV